MNNQDFKLKAKFNLKTYYWNLFVVGIILIAIMTSSAALVGIVLTGPAMVGVNQYRLHIARTNTEDTNLLVAGFKGKVLNHIITFVLMSFFIFLWTLLLIIPGIIKTFSYSMTFFILADNPDLEPQEAIKRSREMMHGHKWRLFKLYLSFIGWYLLVLLTFGVGMIFLDPYINLSVTHFYEDLKTRT